VLSSSHKRNDSEGSLNRTEIPRAVIADAESIDIGDRNKIEQLTSQVIEHLERQRTLPGMEHLVPKYRRQKRPFAESEIQAAIREILAAEETISLIPKEKHLSAEPVVRKGNCTRRRENAK